MCSQRNFAVAERTGIRLKEDGQEEHESEFDLSVKMLIMNEFPDLRRKLGDGCCAGEGLFLLCSYATLAVTAVL